MITVPEHLIVGEPELKWCEAIIRDYQTGPINRPWAKAILMLMTNMAEIRVERALNLLYRANRI